MWGVILGNYGQRQQRLRRMWILVILDYALNGGFQRTHCSIGQAVLMGCSHWRPKILPPEYATQ